MGELWQREAAVLWEYRGHLVPTWEPRTRLLEGGLGNRKLNKWQLTRGRNECRANELQWHMMWLPSGTGRESGVQGHPLLRGRFQVRPGYTRPPLRKQRLEKWQLRHLLILQRPWVLFPVSTWHLTTAGASDPSSYLCCYHTHTFVVQSCGGLMFFGRRLGMFLHSSISEVQTNVLF